MSVEATPEQTPETPPVLNNRVINNIEAFLKRTEIKGSEAAAMVEALSTLKLIKFFKPKPKKEKTDGHEQAQ